MAIDMEWIMECQKWSVKSDALLTTRSRDHINGLKRDVATNWPIAENGLQIIKDKRLNMLTRYLLQTLVTYQCDTLTIRMLLTYSIEFPIKISC